MSLAVPVSDFGLKVLDVVGDRIRILVDSSATQGHCVVFECVTQPNSGPPLHRHNREDEHFYIVEGTVKFLVDGREHVRTAGESITARRGTIHTFCNVGEVESRMIITCTPGGLESCFRAAAVLCEENRATIENLTAAFAPIDLTFHGPPLAAMGMARSAIG